MRLSYRSWVDLRNAWIASEDRKHDEYGEELPALPWPPPEPDRRARRPSRAIPKTAARRNGKP
jgi:hypothetical protein